jgi:hypothetical protein
MAADTQNEGGPHPSPSQIPEGANSPFGGSQLPAELAAEIGRCLKSRYRVIPEEPLPEDLAALVRQLQQQVEKDSPEA